MTDTKWQRALLPFMQVVIVLLTAFYLIASYVQFSYFAERVEKPHNADVKQFLSNIGTNALLNDSVSLEEKRWIAQCFFEAYTIDSRQKNAEFLMISRTWIKYLGFITGVILAVVGAVFILGKLKDEQPSEFDTGKESFKFSFKSHSPGIIMATFGTVLILSTIFTHQTIEKTDGAVYLLPFSPSASRAYSPEISEALRTILQDTTLNQQPDSTAQRPPGF